MHATAWIDSHRSFRNETKNEEHEHNDDRNDTSPYPNWNVIKKMEKKVLTVTLPRWLHNTTIQIELCWHKALLQFHINISLLLLLFLSYCLPFVEILLLSSITRDRLLHCIVRHVTPLSTHWWLSGIRKKFIRTQILDKEKELKSEENKMYIHWIYIPYGYRDWMESPPTHVLA